ncbi:MAG: N-acetylmuramoyl-L-alanine amidase [Calditrichaeota bacterium]|nr:N-acetylmuramoyl-L-alanine amidase [Calditrichota bacterium]
MREITEIILHCSDSEFGDAKLIDDWHRARGWSGIGYHFVILNPYPDDAALRLGRPQFDQDGVVQEGRALSKPGAHCEGRNVNSVGICLIGKRLFTAAQFKSLVELTTGLIKQFAGTKALGHYEAQKPGSVIKTCPNLDMEWMRNRMGL